MLRRALGKLTKRPFPPDLGAVLDAAENRLDEEDVRKSWRRVVAAAGQTPPGWHALNAVELAAACEFGGFEIRNGTEAGFARFCKILGRLAGRTDLPTPPPAPAKALPHKPNLDIVDSELAKCREMLQM